ncbi:MAG: biopolymer transporter ExbD [Verrucomicrobia bacterium]|nr:biopolymer transporter ExbD [Verrucomicrobiota bacterium]
MKHNDCGTALYLHRTFVPRRPTGLGVLAGTVFLNAALLFSAFVLVTSHFVLKPGISLDLPVASQTQGIQFNDMVLSISREGLFFFNDEQVQIARLENVLRAAIVERPGTALILEAASATPQSTAATVYDAAARAGFRQIFIATRSAVPAVSGTASTPAP